MLGVRLHDKACLRCQFLCQVHPGVLLGRPAADVCVPGRSVIRHDAELRLHHFSRWNVGASPDRLAPQGGDIIVAQPPDPRFAQATRAKDRGSVFFAGRLEGTWLDTTSLGGKV